MRRSGLTKVLNLAILTIPIGLTGCGGSGDDPAPPALGPAATATVVSSRPDMVSENSALVKVVVPQVTGAAPAKITLGNTDISSQFKTAVDGSLLGIVAGLPDGKNTVTVSFNGVSSTLDLVSHGRNGPIISGPQQKPWICQTEVFPLPDGTSLGQPVDVNCNAPTNVQYVYMPTTGTAFKVMASTATVPSDVKTTTTSDGKNVNYIVRLETGTLNRGIYQFAVLFDPTTEAAPSPTTTYKAWNRKIVYTFGGSAQAGYVQGKLTGGVLDDLMLAKGFAVISNTLNVFGNNENDVLSAETVSMTKERYIKAFGVAIYTMGWGPSGASMQQHLIANNYPGLLDGITPWLSFSDFLTVASSSTDCSLFSRAFQASSQSWSNEQKTAVSGFQDYKTCEGTPTFSPVGWEQTYSPHWLVPRRAGPPLIPSLTNCLFDVPDALVYDPVTNPGGARCDMFSNSVNLYGIEPTTGFAARAIDNVGVQYGLRALQSGAITPEQFIELNERVGGYDAEGNIVAARSVASSIGLNSAYAYGRVNEAKNLGDLPIIDYRTYLDPDIHDAVRSIITRERIKKAGGSAANQVILQAQGAGAAALPGIVLQSMDTWLSNIAKDTKAYASRAEQVVANKPSDLSDACYTATGTKITEAADINNGGQCGALMPYFGNPRIAAGGPITDDVLKCQLKPLARADYPGINDAQFARLGVAFSSGVCDYTKLSAGYQPLQSTWLSYPNPGQPVPLGPAN